MEDMRGREKTGRMKQFLPAHPDWSYLSDFSLNFLPLQLAQFRSPLSLFSEYPQVLFLLLHIFQELLHAGGFQ